MCLYRNSYIEGQWLNKNKNPEKEVVCYKAMRMTKKGNLNSPVYPFKKSKKLGQTIAAKDRRIPSWSIYGEGVHAFRTLADAKNEYSDWTIVKCVGKVKDFVGCDRMEIAFRRLRLVSIAYKSNWDRKQNED